MSARSEKKWLIERKPDVFESIWAAEIVVKQGGVLLFLAEDGANPELLLAPGEWVSVCPDVDA